MSLCAFFAIFCICAAIAAAIHQPSLGISWTTHETYPGLVVGELHVNIPGLRAGDRVTAFRAENGRRLETHREMIVADPDLYTRYSQYNHFFAHQQATMEVLRQSSVGLVKDDGKTVTVPVRRHRSAFWLPAAFWIYNLTGVVCLIIGVGVWCYRRGEPSARLLALAGMAFFMGQVCFSIYAAREIAMDVTVFKVLNHANHIFMFLFPYSLFLLFWYYPIRLGKPLVVWVTYLVMGLLWLTTVYQWFEFPFHAFHFPMFVVPYCAALPLGVIQWKKTASLPTERAALKWYLLAILVSLGITTPLLLLPGIHNISLVYPLWAASFLVLFMFVGLALGVLKYNLFQLERWWYLGWLWFGSYMLVIGLDILLVRLLQISPDNAIIFAILLVLWIYFPLRQWLWNRWIHPPEHLLQKHLPKLIHVLFSSSSPQSLVHQWGRLLQQIFNPLDIRLLDKAQSAVSATRNAQVMRVPTLNGDRTYELSYKQKGARLFGNRDIELAQAIYTIARESIRLKQSHDQSVAAERRRIMRDLHDDVSGKLLQLMHSTDSAPLAQLARSAHKSLRDTIYISIDSAEKPLEEILADWRAELSERLETERLQLEWRQPADLQGFYLTPRQHINCGRILNEAVSNILNHTRAGEIRIAFEIEKNVQGHYQLCMDVADNGRATDMSQWVEGVGLNNMRTRARELSGTICWVNKAAKSSQAGSGITVELRFPLHKIPSGIIPAATNKDGNQHCLV